MCLSCVPRRARSFDFAVFPSLLIGGKSKVECACTQAWWRTLFAGCWALSVLQVYVHVHVLLA